VRGARAGQFFQGDAMPRREMDSQYHCKKHNFYHPGDRAYQVCFQRMTVQEPSTDSVAIPSCRLMRSEIATAIVGDLAPSAISAIVGFASR
jgi:hypothetical protein